MLSLSFLQGHPVSKLVDIIREIHVEIKELESSNMEKLCVSCYLIIIDYIDVCMYFLYLIIFLFNFKFYFLPYAAGEDTILHSNI